MKATSYLLEGLRSEGIDHAFLVPGGLIDPFLPALSGTPGVTPIVAAHEGGAAYMADGYARASGRFGVCFAIGGPGISNTATAVPAARSDGSPVLVVSGQVATELEGRGAFQDDSPGTAIDDTAALAPLVVSSQEVIEPHLLGHHLRLALEAMRRGEAPERLEPGERALVEAADLVLERGPLPERLQARLVAEIGEPALLELVVLVGFYATIAGFIAAFEVPLPEGAEQPF